METDIKSVRNQIIEFIQSNPESSSKEIHEGIGETIGYSSVKRELKDLLKKNLIAVSGNRKSTRYELSKSYSLLHTINEDDYFKKEADERGQSISFNHTLIRDILAQVSLFTEDEMTRLNELQKKFSENTSTLSEHEFNKEFERLAIDLSWKSSQIEGNTYSLLETERLLKEKETAAGKTKDEASMLLNHIEALDFILENPGYVQPLTTSGIEDIHSILIKDLNVSRNIRSRRVGISGTNYLPLDNEFQIKEAMSEMCTIVNWRDNVFEKALLVLALISYIQPFSDGNKRTARIISNAILMNYKHCPLSFRTVDSLAYKKAMLIFYEKNNLSAFKKIFIDQFEFAVKTYF